jgi:ribosomal protein S18
LQTSKEHVDESKSIVFEPEESTYKEINKYVCRYDILLDKIDYNKDFEIAKKIIGPNGKNMKDIVDKCTKLERQNELEHNYN